ncbi:MAG: hypothetical protein AAF939_22275, partial [Planctomycetota bacterium]
GIPTLSEHFVGKNAVAKSVTPINDSAAFSRYDNRLWTAVVGEFDLSAETALLEKDLFVDADNPALSLDAAAGLLTAKKRIVAEVGGEITEVLVEAMGNRFSNLPDAMDSMVPLDSAPEIETTSKLNNSLLRFNIEPKWIRHDYFFKKL